MPYVPIGFVDEVDGVSGTDLDAAVFNHMEDGIVAAHVATDDFGPRITTLESGLAVVEGDVASLQSLVADHETRIVALESAPPPAVAMELILDHTVSSAGTNLDTNTLLGGNIPQGYKHLRCILEARGSTAAALVGVAAVVNNDTGTNYDATRHGFSGASLSGAEFGTRGDFPMEDMPGANHAANMFGNFELIVPFYSETHHWKALKALYSVGYQAAVSGARSGQVVGNWRSTSAVTRLRFNASSGNFIVGTRLMIYGLRA